MDSVPSIQAIKDTRPVKLKYALNDGVSKSRDAMKKAARIGNWIGSVLPFIAGGAFVIASWNLDWDGPLKFWDFVLLAAGIFIAVYLIHILVGKVAIALGVRKAVKFLQGDKTATWIAQDFDVPEASVRAAVKELITDRSGWAKFTHNDEVIKLTLSKQWDDLLGENVRYIKVKRRPAVSVTKDLITY